MTTGAASDADVLDAIQDALDSNERAVVATVVNVEGRAYRRPGARMLVTPDERTGAVTAGCVEDEVRRIAEDVLASGSPRVETYDLTSGEDVWGLGLGCEGVVDLLLEPLDDRHRPLVEAHKSNEAITLPVVIETDDDRFSVGDRLDLEERSTVPETIREQLASVEDSNRTVEVQTRRGAVTVFLDRVEPSPELLVVGTGHDVDPIVDLASNIDFEVTVVGFRGAEVTEGRFQGADRVLSTSPRSLADEVDVDDRTYAVLATHNLVDDRIAMETLLDTSTPYVGVMGPRERFGEIRDALSEEKDLSSDDLSRVYAPVGLDLGGGDPYEIAHSVVAEVLAVQNDRTGGHLRRIDGPIHDRPKTPEE